MQRETQLDRLRPKIAASAREQPGALVIGEQPARPGLGWADESITRGSAAARLALLLPEGRVVRKTNLLPWSIEWDTELARVRARELAGYESALGTRWLIFCGRRVAHAFGCEHQRWLRPFIYALVETGARSWIMHGLLLPHPSGRNRFWNEARNRAHARRVLARILR